MTTARTRIALAAAMILAAGLGCSSKSSETYSIGGTITGLTTAGLVLGSTGQPDLTIPAGQTSFAFANKVASGTRYDVIVVAQASQGSCSVTRGAGVVAGADVTSVVVTCDGSLSSDFSGPLNVARAFYFTAIVLPGRSPSWPNDDKVLVAGGHTGSDAVTASAEVFNPRTGKWTMAASMTVPRASACSALLPSGKVLVAGGAGAVGNTAEVYDPATDTWTPTDHPMAAGHDLPGCVVLASGKVLIAGGLNQVNTGSNAVSELYDPETGTFTTTGPMVTARYWHTATELPSGKVLVTGGCTGGYPCTATTATAELYDPVSGTWSATGDLPAGVFGHTATSVPDGVLVVGGCKSDDACGPTGAHTGNAEKAASLYHPTTGAFEAAGEMTTGRVGHAVAFVDQGFRFFGGTYGAEGSRTTDVYGWDGATWAWTAAGPLTIADHGSYLQAVRGYMYEGEWGQNGPYWLVIGGLVSSAGTYSPTAAVEGAFECCSN
ncbi:MAG: hypothetical protein HZB56_10290 [Deltaproteobacteria bacterium]|nr:hypothetical protein [Deltaproteobacteria bacterium]